MTGRMLAFLAAAVVGVVVLCSGLVAVLFGGLGASAACAGLLPTASTNPQPTTDVATTVSAALPSSGGQGIGPWSGEQVGNATIIIGTGMRRQVPPRGWVIAIATAMQESGLRNLGDLSSANDHDSLGLFQQRPSQGWGSPVQIMDPAYSSTRFYDKLLKIRDWQNLPLTVVAQKVQVSAYPEAYAKHEAAAADLVTTLTGLTGSLGVCGGEVGPQGWTQPVLDLIVSGFGSRDGGFHYGADLGSPKGTPIHAAASGKVVTAVCNAHANGADFGCDRDGGVWVSGCGWYVDIEHTGGILTRYCHMLSRPVVSVGQQVTAGQVIGVTGSSGNSSGPHLHFEVHLGGDSGNAGAIDPVPWQQSHQAPLTS